jgi:hypothetical protein
MDLATVPELDELWASDAPGEHVSLFLPTHRPGTDVQADALQLKNLLTGVDNVLDRRGMRRTEIEELLSPAWALQQDPRAWAQMRDGLAIYVRPGWSRVFRVPVSMPTFATIGDRWVLAPLLHLIGTDEHFLLLAVTQRTLRLFEGDRDRLEEVELAQLPTSQREMLETPGRSRPMARPLPASGGSNAVFYGHGGGREQEKEDLRQFLHRAADGLNEYLASRRLPLVLAGLPEVLAVYRDANEYPHVVPEAVEKNPDGLSVEDLHALAWQIVDRRREQRTVGALERFAAQHGTGLASTDIDVIAQAAAEGRVATLFVTEAAIRCWEQPVGEPVVVVELGGDERFARCEVLDRVVIDTIRRDGEVHLLPDLRLAGDQELPGADELAAIFRY